MHQPAIIMRERKIYYDARDGKRSYVPGAQGVTLWYRKFGNHWYQFIYVHAGWWGVGPTGTCIVSRAISNGDYYPVHRYLLKGQS